MPKTGPLLVALFACNAPLATQTTPAPIELTQVHWFGGLGSTVLSDIAYDASSNLYCLVTAHNDATFLGANHVRALRFLADGTPFGNPITLHQTANGRYLAVSVSNVQQTGVFAIAWNIADLSSRVEAVNLPATGSVAGPTTTVATGVSSPFQQAKLFGADAAGDPSGVSDKAVLVWRDERRIQAAHVTTTGAAQIASYVTVASSTAPSTTALSQSTVPKISKALDTGTGAYAHCVVWSDLRWSSLRSAYQLDVYAALIDPRSAVLYGTPILVSTSSRSSLSDDTNPDVDGNSREFLVSWERHELGGDRNIMCRRVDLTASNQLAIASPELSVAAVAGVDERSPSVSWLGSKYAITYQVETATTVSWCGTAGPTSLAARRYENWVTVRSAEDGSSCGLTQLLDGASNPTRLPQAPVAVARRSGQQGAGEDGLLFWLELCNSAYLQPYPPIWFERSEFHGYTTPFAAFGGGPVTDLGGGCGVGGVLTAPSPAAVGNPSFRLQLAGVGPSTTFGLLVAGMPGPGLPCAGCVLQLPDYATAVFGVSTGGATINLPLACVPSWVGQEIVWQTWVPSPGPCPLLAPASASNRLSTILGW